MAVFLPAGEYRVSDTLELYQPVKIGADGSLSYAWEGQLLEGQTDAPGKRARIVLAPRSAGYFPLRSTVALKKGTALVGVQPTRSFIVGEDDLDRRFGGFVKGGQPLPIVSTAEGKDAGNILSFVGIRRHNAVIAHSPEPFACYPLQALRPRHDRPVQRRLRQSRLRRHTGRQDRRREAG